MWCVSVSHSVGVAIVSFLESIFSQSVVNFFWFDEWPWSRSFCAHTVHIRLIDHSCLETLLVERAFFLVGAVASWILGFFSIGFQDFCVLASDLILHVAHCRVGEFDGVSVDDSSEWVSLGEVLSHQMQESCTYIGFDTFAEWRVPIGHWFRPVFLPLLLPFLLELEFEIVPTGPQRFLVHWLCFFEDFLVL